MAKLQYRTISKRTVDGLSVDEKDAVFWDRELPGFGVRVYPSGSKVYVVQTRAKGKSKRVTLGRHGVISADQARRKAAETIARIKSGEDPEGKPASTVTVADVAARYLKEHVALHCKPGTAKLYRSVVKRFILPAYGHLAVEEVEREHIADLHYELRDMPYQANRVLEIGNKLFNLAELWKLRTGSNPCKFCAQVPGEEARAVPHRRGISPSRRRIERNGGGQDPAGVSGRGVSPADADRVPTQRDRDA